MEKVILNRIDEMRDEIIQFLQKLIQYPSEIPPRKYREISRFIANKMGEFGINTKIKRNNVIGELGNEDGPSLIFNAHFDTVTIHDGWTKNPYGGDVIDDKIYGRGSSDDKSCVAAEIFAAKALLDADVDLQGKLIISAVVNEEIGGIAGTEYIVNEGIVNGDVCLLGDAPAEYPTAYQGGVLQFSFTIKGIRRHAMAYPDLPSKYRNQYSGINAVHKMILIMNFLMKLQEEFEKKETKYPVPPDLPKRINSVTITKMDGGNAIDTVADNCNLHCLINVIPEQDIYMVKTKVLNFIEEIKKSDPDLDIIVQIPVIIVPQVADINSKFAIVVKDAFKTVFNEEREFKAFIPTTDAHHFQKKGIETILIGTFRGDNNIHGQDEFVYINDLINTTKIYALTALNYLKSVF